VSQCYISGPINGYPEHNRLAFHYAERDLKVAGWEVINPVELGQIEGGTWAQYMERDLPYVFSSQLVVALPGWELSRGARWEIQEAMDRKIQVLPLEIALMWVRPEYLLESITK
jgi:hypothetical protein